MSLISRNETVHPPKESRQTPEGCTSPFTIMVGEFGQFNLPAKVLRVGAKVIPIIKARAISCVQKSTGSRPSFRMSMTVNILPQPVALLSNTVDTHSAHTDLTGKCSNYKSSVSSTDTSGTQKWLRSYFEVKLLMTPIKVRVNQ